jgi:hypothetical protein
MSAQPEKQHGFTRFTEKVFGRKKKLKASTAVTAEPGHGRSPASTAQQLEVPASQPKTSTDNSADISTDVEALGTNNTIKWIGKNSSMPLWLSNTMI